MEYSYLKTFASTVLISIALSAGAKTLKVEKFEPEPFDLTAYHHQRLDLNDVPCALVKVCIPVKGMVFEGSIIGDCANKAGEYWVYMTAGTKFIKIKHETVTPLFIRFSDYNIHKLLTKQTYTLVLSVDEGASSKQQGRSIYEMIDTPDGDPIEDMVVRANGLYENGYYAEAIPILAKAAGLGHAEAQFSLGLLYELGVKSETGIILEKDEAKAFENVKKSATQGFMPAQKQLSNYYRIGMGCTPNNRFADQWMNIYNKNSQLIDKPISEEDDNKVFDSVEIDPVFPGGQKALLKWVSDHIRYPSVAQENGIQGRVTVQFVVTKTGAIGPAKVVQSKYPDLDEEAIRVCQTLPNFINPGYMNGRPVNVLFTLPITFKLQSGDEEKKESKIKGFFKKIGNKVNDIVH